MRAGQLNKRVTLLRPTAIRDEALEERGEFTPVGVRFAAVRPLSGQELFSAQQTQSEATTEFTLRYVAGLDATWQIKYGAAVFHVLSVVDPDAKHEWHVVLCKCLA